MIALDLFALNSKNALMWYFRVTQGIMMQAGGAALGLSMLALLVSTSVAQLTPEPESEPADAAELTSESEGEATDAAGLTPEQQRELTYADGLISMGLPRYAEIVLASSGLPAAEVKVMRIRGLCARGEFDSVKAIIAEEPDPITKEALQLTMADALFAWSKFDEARLIYQAFFDKYKAGIPDALRAFFVDSAYKFAQMQLLTNNRAGAIEAYRMGIKAEPPRNAKRQLQADMAELILKMAQETPAGEARTKLTDEAEAVVDALLWYNEDLWFGKALVMKAHLMLLAGSVDKAMNVFDYYRQDLLRVHDSLVEMSKTEGTDLTRLSPLAQARFLLGVMLQDEAERMLREGGDKRRAAELLAGSDVVSGGRKPEAGKDEALPKTTGALQHFINVGVRYPNTPWAADALKRTEAIKTILVEQFGITVAVDVTPKQWEAVKTAQFTIARATFNQQQFEEAAKLYRHVLSAFPEGATTLSALSDLAACYVELDDSFRVDTVIGYLGDRFAGRRGLGDEAGNVVLRLAMMYEDRAKTERKDATYAQFFALFPTHPRTPNLLFYFGSQRHKLGDIPGAMKYFDVLIKEQKGQPLYYDTLRQVAAIRLEAGDTAGALEMLDLLIKDLAPLERPGQEYISALYSKASAYRRLETPQGYVQAANGYGQIIKLLTEAPTKYQSNAEQGENNLTIRQGAMFFRAFCLSRLPEGMQDKPQGYYKKIALDDYLKLVAAFPKTNYAPPALLSAGSLQFALGQPEEAKRTFELLKKNYADSPEAKNADFRLAMILLDLGFRKDSIALFKQMFSGTGGKFSPGEILLAGAELAKAEEFEIALEAFTDVLAKTKDEGLISRALMGKGQCLIGLKRFDEATAVLEELLDKYKRSTLAIDASILLSRSYLEMGKKEDNAAKRRQFFNKAVERVKMIRSYAQDDAARQAWSIVRTGEIREAQAIVEEQKGNKDIAAEYRNEAMAIYTILLLEPDTANAEAKPHLDTAFGRCLPLYAANQRWDDALELSETYFRLFGSSGKNAREIRRIQSEARTKVVTAPAGAGSAPAAKP